MYLLFINPFGIFSLKFELLDFITISVPFNEIYGIGLVFILHILNC